MKNDEHVNKPGHTPPLAKVEVWVKWACARSRRLSRSSPCSTGSSHHDLHLLLGVKPKPNPDSINERNEKQKSKHANTQIYSGSLNSALPWCCRFLSLIMKEMTRFFLAHLFLITHKCRQMIPSRKLGSPNTIVWMPIIIGRGVRWKVQEGSTKSNISKRYQGKGDLSKITKMS